MISPTSLLSAPSMIGDVHPARDSNVPARRPGLEHLKEWVPVSLRPAVAPPAGAETDLGRFLRRNSMELDMLYELQPDIHESNLQSPQTFDAVLQRTRKALRDGAAQGGPDGAVFEAALQVLDQNVVLRAQSRSIRNALYQG